MLHEKIFFDGEPENVYLDTYIPDKINGFTRKSILVIPGGAYGTVCSEREGEPIALSFLEKGFNAFVLHYSVNGEKTFPAQLIQASKAMGYIRETAEKYGADKNQVYTVGFSAGGHLAGSLAVLWDREDVTKAMGYPKGTNRPEGAMLIYPVISADSEFGHLDSIYNLVGSSELTKEQEFETSLEKHVSKASSPAFILHTATDQLVNVQNSLAMAKAYAEKGLKFELHIYPDAPHGIALGNEITECGENGYNKPTFAKWTSMAIDWINQL